MRIDGACHCGAIVFEAEADPDKVGICHCSDCQALSASAFRTFVVVPGESLDVIKGTPREYFKIGDSGNPRIQGFCGNCGSGLYATGTGEGPKMYNIRAGTVRQRDQLVPKFEVWRQSALSWIPELSNTKKFDRGPV